MAFHGVLREDFPDLTGETLTKSRTIQGESIRNDRAVVKEKQENSYQYLKEHA
jgi:hypothetical protein